MSKLPSGNSRDHRRQAQPQQGGSILRGGAWTRVEPSHRLCDRFLLQEEVRHSRLGPVYRALDEELSGEGASPHYVDVQLLPREIGDDWQRLARFKRELVTIQSWSHPNIAKIFSFERDGNRCFLTMEHLDGETLRTILNVLKPELLPKDEVFPIITAVGNAMAFIDARGGLCAPLSLNSVLVTRDSQVKLINVLPLDGAAGIWPTSSFHAGGSAYGDYVRDLACLAFELLTGRRPFAAGSASFADGKMAPKRIPGLSRTASQALSDALGRNRDRRFRNVASFLAALELPGAEKRPVVVAAQQSRVRRNQRKSRRWWIAAVPASLAIGMAIYLNFAAIGGITESVRDTLQTALQDDGLNSSAPSGALVTDEASRLVAVPSQQPPETDTVYLQTHPDDTLLDSTPSASVREASVNDAGAENVGIAVDPATDSSDTSAETVTHAPAPGQFSFATEVVTVRESQGVAAITINRDGGSDGPASVIWWTSEGTASAYDDYIDFGARIESFEHGEEQRAVHIPLVVDSIPGDRKTFYVHLREGSGAPLGEVTRKTVVIIDDS